MTIVKGLTAETFLKSRNVPFEITSHESADSALLEASAVGISPRWVLKAVLLKPADGYALAVLPASRMLDMSLVRDAIGTPEVRLATEGEMEEAFPEFELGALPPLPDLLGIPAYVDPSCFVQDEAVFADGRRTESLIASPRKVMWGQQVFVVPIVRALDLFIEGDSVHLG